MIPYSHQLRFIRLILLFLFYHTQRVNPLCYANYTSLRHGLFTKIERDGEKFQSPLSSRRADDDCHKTERIKSIVFHIRRGDQKVERLIAPSTSFAR
jgi:hypothetical protein